MNTLTYFDTLSLKNALQAVLGYEVDSLTADQVNTLYNSLSVGQTRDVLAYMGV